MVLFQELIDILPFAFLFSAMIEDIGHDSNPIVFKGTSAVDCKE